MNRERCTANPLRVHPLSLSESGESVLLCSQGGRRFGKEASVKFHLDSGPFGFHSLTSLPGEVVKGGFKTVWTSRLVERGITGNVLNYYQEDRLTASKTHRFLGESEREAMVVFENASRNSHTDSHTDVMGKETWSG